MPYLSKLMTLQFNEGSENCPGSLASHFRLLLPYHDSEMTRLLAGAMDVKKKRHLSTQRCPGWPGLVQCHAKSQNLLVASQSFGCYWSQSERLGAVCYPSEACWPFSRAVNMPETTFIFLKV